MVKRASSSPSRKPARTSSRKVRAPGPAVAAALAGLEAFGDVDAEALRHLTAGGRVMALPKGKTLFKEGDATDDVYIVLSGTLTVTVRNNKAVTRLGRGDLAGEIASLAGGGRSATIKAAVASRVVKLSAGAFRGVLAERPHLAGRVAVEARRRLLEGQLRVLLARAFGALDDDITAALLDQTEWVTLRAGEMLFGPGEEADAAFIVVFGTIHLGAGVSGPDGGGPSDVFDEAGAGEIIGASALVAGGLRKGSASAARDSYLVRIPRAALKTLEDRHPRGVLALTRALLERVKLPSSRRVAGPVCLAVVAASPDTDLRFFVSKLVDEMSAHTSVFHAWSARVDATLGREGIAQSPASDIGHISLTRWLQQLRQGHDVVVLEADREWTPWTERVAREADRVLVLGPGPDATATEQKLFSLFPRGNRPRIAALLHASAPGSPSGTAARLAARDYDEHCHVRAGVPSDFTRLARIVTGRAVGLALGGGGARGFAHIGVLRALGELGVPIDFVGGASIGAVIAALAADEQSPEAMTETVEDGFSKLRDYTLPMVSLLKGKRTAMSIRNFFGDRSVEDLAIPAFLVTTNLTRNVATYHRCGELVRVLRASTAIPGIYPPVVIDGEIHVDGGVLDNLPIEEMRRWHPDAGIIAVDLTPAAGPRAKEDFGLWVSGVRAAGRTIRRDRKRRLPGLGETMVRVSVVASTRDRDRLVDEGAADLYLPLTMRGVSPMDFETVRPVVQMGYDQAMPAITAWLDDGGMDARSGDE